MTTFAIPKTGTLERIMLDKLMEKGDEGVNIFDLQETGIDENNIDKIVENLKTGNFEHEEATSH